jgi:hypothetical protein
MRTGTSIALNALLLAGLILYPGRGDVRADPDCFTIDRSRPEWGPASSGIEAPDGPVDVPALETGISGVVPNPFSIGTTIGFAVPAGIEQATIRIFDPTGRLLRELQPVLHAPGVHQVHWDRRDQSGRLVPPGICFYRIELGGSRVQGRMVLVD